MSIPTENRPFVRCFNTSKALSF